MFGLLLLAQVPVAALMLLVESLALEPLGGEIDFGTWYGWAGLLGLVLGDVVIAILRAAAFTFAYGHLTGFPLPGARGDAPVQPSLPFDAPV